MSDSEDELPNNKTDRFSRISKKSTYGASVNQKSGYNVENKKLKENIQDFKESKLLSSSSSK